VLSTDLKVKVKVKLEKPVRHRGW